MINKRKKISFWEIKDNVELFSTFEEKINYLDSLYEANNYTVTKFHILVTKCDLLTKNGFEKEAIKIYKGLTNMNGNYSLMAVLKLGTIYRKLFHYEESLRYLDEICNNSDENIRNYDLIAEAYMEKAHIYISKKDYDKARKNLEIADVYISKYNYHEKRKESLNSQNYYLFGVLEFCEGNMLEALEYIQKASVTRISNFKFLLYYKLGLLDTDLKESDDKYFEKQVIEYNENRAKEHIVSDGNEIFGEKIDDLFEYIKKDIENKQPLYSMYNDGYLVNYPIGIEYEGRIYQYFSVTTMLNNKNILYILPYRYNLPNELKNTQNTYSNGKELKRPTQTDKFIRRLKKIEKHD